MEEDILNYLPTVMFLGTPCIFAHISQCLLTVRKRQAISKLNVLPRAFIPPVSLPSFFATPPPPFTHLQAILVCIQEQFVSCTQLSNISTKPIQLNPI